MTIYYNYIDNYFSFDKNNFENNNLSLLNLENKQNKEKVKINEDYQNLNNYNILNSHIYSKNKSNNNSESVNNSESDNNNTENDNNSEKYSNIKIGLSKNKYNEEICLKVKCNIINNNLLELIDNYENENNLNKNIIFENLNNNENNNIKFKVDFKNWKIFCKNLNILIFNCTLIKSEFNLKHLLYCKNINIFNIKNLNYDIFKNNEENLIQLVNLKKLKIFEIGINYLIKNYNIYKKIEYILKMNKTKYIFNY